MKGKDFFDVNFFLQPDSRPLFYQFIAELKESCAKAEPTATHHFLKNLAKEGKLSRWYTQNIDCLEERLGLNCWTTSTTSTNTTGANNTNVVSLHGTLSQVSCTLCKVTTEFIEEYMDHFKTGKELPCKACAEVAELRESTGRRKLRSGFLRPDIVLYNEPHPHGETIADFVRTDISKQPTLLLIMGTSLKISGLKKMIKDFAKSMKSRPGGENSLVVYVNKTACSRAEWQGVFDYELIGECDQWINFLQEEHQLKKSKSATVSASANVTASATVGASFTVVKAEAIIKASTDKSITVKPAIPKAQSNIPTVTVSSPVQPKQKKKKPAATLVEVSISSSSSPLPTTPTAPTKTRRIDDFFTPVKSGSSFPARLAAGKDSKDLELEKAASGKTGNKQSLRVKKGTGLAM